MTMQAVTIDILIEKAKFEPRVAIAVAEAIDEAISRNIQSSQLVTVPVLDARLAELKSDLRTEMHGMRSELLGEMHSTKGDLARQMYLAILGQMAVLLGIAYFFVTHLNK